MPKLFSIFDWAISAWNILFEFTKLVRAFVFCKTLILYFHIVVLYCVMFSLTWTDFFFVSDGRGSRYSCDWLQDTEGLDGKTFVLVHIFYAIIYTCRTRYVLWCYITHTYVAAYRNAPLQMFSRLIRQFSAMSNPSVTDNNFMGMLLYEPWFVIWKRFGLWISKPGAHFLFATV